MLNPPIADRLPRKIPRSVNVVHKTGLIYDNAHDVGILYLPGDNEVLVSAMVDNIGTQYRKAKAAIADIARILYDEAVEGEKRRTARPAA
jgi:beta-lactamase class A